MKSISERIEEVAALQRAKKVEAQEHLRLMSGVAQLYAESFAKEMSLSYLQISTEKNGILLDNTSTRARMTVLCIGEGIFSVKSQSLDEDAMLDLVIAFADED